MAAPATAAQLIQQGLFHHRQGHLALAMDRYTEVLRNDPHNADALYYVAVVACQEGQFQQGIELARRSLSLQPRPGARAQSDRPGAAPRWARSRRRWQAFDAALECDVKFADAYGNRANMLSELGRHAEALSSFDRALELNPNSATDWLNRGATLHSARPHRRGDRELRPRHRARRRTLPCRISTAPQRLHAMGRFEDALAGYDRAIALAPKWRRRSRGRAGSPLGRARPLMSEARASLATRRQNSRRRALGAPRKKAAEKQAVLRQHNTQR